MEQQQQQQQTAETAKQTVSAAAVLADEEAERCEFLSNLFRFMAERGSSISYIPIFDHRELDLWKLYKSVTARGGLAAVVENKLWRQVTGELGVDQDRTDAGFRLRMHYQKYLYPYERCFFLGMADSPGAGSPVILPSAQSSPVRSVADALASEAAAAAIAAGFSLHPSSDPAAAASPSAAVAPTSAVIAESGYTASPTMGPVTSPRHIAASLSLRGVGAGKPASTSSSSRQAAIAAAAAIQRSSRMHGLGMGRVSAVDLRKLGEAALLRYGKLHKLPVSATAKDELVALTYEHFVTQDVDEAVAIAQFFSVLRARK